MPGWPSIWRTTYYAGTTLPDAVAEQVAAQTWEHYTPHMLNVCGNTTVHNAARAAAEVAYAAGRAVAYAAGRADERAERASTASILDHPHIDPGDGRTECERCGKFVHEVTHSCKGVPVTARAEARMWKREAERLRAERGEHLDD